MVSSGNNNFLTCTNGNRCIGNIKVLKFYLVVGTYVDVCINQMVDTHLSKDLEHTWPIARTKVILENKLFLRVTIHIVRN